MVAQGLFTTSACQLHSQSIGQNQSCVSTQLQRVLGNVSSVHPVRKRAPLLVSIKVYSSGVALYYVNLAQLELHFPESLFSLRLQVNFDHRRYFHEIGKVGMKQQPVSSGIGTTHHCSSQPDLLAHLVGVGQQAACRPPAPVTSPPSASLSSGSDVHAIPRRRAPASFLGQMGYGV